LAIGLVVVCGLVATADAGESNGARYYRRDCARCHGPHGRGDGPDAVIFPDPPRNLRTEFLNKYSNAELVRRVRRGSPLRLAVDPQALQSRERDVMVLADYLRRLPTVDWGRVELGHGVYAERCASCHGVYGHPPKTPAPGSKEVPASRDLSDPTFQRATTDERLQALVLDGHAPGLRPRLKLSATETAAVAAYVRILMPGHELYSRFCSNCHGDTGRADLSSAEGDPRPKISFDEAYFALHDSAYVTERIWHMLTEEKPHMPHLRHEVSETAANAIVRFLKEVQD
jgi:mono/diheme cytochrome c family protein